MVAVAVGEWEWEFDWGVCGFRESEDSSVWFISDKALPEKDLWRSVPSSGLDIWPKGCVCESPMKWFVVFYSS